MSRLHEYDGKHRPGEEAIMVKGWFQAHRFLILRRLSQILLLGVFLSGPLFGLWIAKGNLASSLTLDFLPLTDPLMALQSILAGHIPEMTALYGVAIVTLFYALIGGRVYCSWVCPVNPVTDLARLLRRRLRLGKGWQPKRATRLWLLGAILLISFLTGTIAWEIINPVSMTHRAILFGIGFSWAVLLAVFLFDLFVSRDGWCGRLCPVGAFYGLLGNKSLLRVRASKRSDCDDCMDCFAVCPEAQIITPALKGQARGLGPVILSGDCTNCGRCIDVCSKQVYQFGWRFDSSEERFPHSINPEQETRAA